MSRILQQSRFVLTMLATAAGVVACGRGGPARAPDAQGTETTGITIKPILERGVGSGGTIALATVGGTRIAFVADEDAKAVLTIDVDGKKELAATKVGGTPSQVFVTKDGRVLVTVRDKNKLVAMRLVHAERPLTTVHETITPAEPIAIATTPDETTVLVTAGWGRALAAFDAKALTARFEAPLPQEPRGVVVSDDGRTAFVSHAVGSVMSTIDLAQAQHATKAIAIRGRDSGARTRLPLALGLAKATKQLDFARGVDDKPANDGRQSCQSFVLAKSTSVPNRIFAPQVMVDPGDPRARTSGYGDAMSIPEVPAVAVIDEGTSKPLPASVAVATRPAHFSKADRDHAETECLLPRAAAIDPQSKTLLVTCFGIDAVLSFSAESGTPSQAPRRHWNVGAGPTGIAIDATKRQAVVFSQFDRTISMFSITGEDAEAELLDDMGRHPPVEKLTLAPLRDGPSPEFIVGRMLFHASGDVRISSDGRACASCHPDGRDDAITWATPDGPRRSIMLAGRVSKTPPYSWDGNATTIQAHLSSTFTRLKGHGLRSSELDSLVSYISGLPAPPPRTVPEEDKAKVERGRQIFASRETGCSQCHAGAIFTDGFNHDVQSGNEVDGAREFNTPSLRFIGGTGPYFHDGRYATLGDLLRKSDGMMGRTKHLSNADLDAPESYLGTL